MTIRSISSLEDTTILFSGNGEVVEGVEEGLSGVIGFSSLGK